eukprot:TRINITY_DN11214_c0_g1_i1.p3 TRINITY_DN11214_c0_g1~~TRINITY_DN11214_c0_g1_i1.p3  ORF type:complete len:110 (+),score=7.97 TRINITY_DN11214_c0_g1_i1:38-331(+)
MNFEDVNNCYLGLFIQTLIRYQQIFFFWNFVVKIRRTFINIFCISRQKITVQKFQLQGRERNFSMFFSFFCVFVLFLIFCLVFLGFFFRRVFQNCFR